VIGLSDVEEDGDLAGPVESGRDLDVIYLSQYAEGDVDVDKWDTDHGSERFGLPEVYKIDPTAYATDFPITGFKVHHSRVIHIAEDLLSNDVYGRPALKRVINRLFDLEKVCAATGEAYWQIAAKILVATIDPDAQVSDAELEKLGEAMEEIMHDLRRQIASRGGEFDWLGGTTPDPSDPADLLMTLIASAAGYPKRILFGSETGERASTEDQKTYLGNVRERQEQFAEPTVLREFIDRLIEWQVIKAPGDGEYDVEWPTLFEVPEKDEAEVDKLRADAAKAITPVGGDPSRLVTISDEGRLKLRAMEEEDSATEIEDEEGPDLPDAGGPPEAQRPPDAMPEAGPTR
jgi:hypothetical protein